MDERPAGPGMSIVAGMARSEVREILFSQRKLILLMVQKSGDTFIS